MLTLELQDQVLDLSRQPCRRGRRLRSVTMRTGELLPVGGSAGKPPHNLVPECLTLASYITGANNMRVPQMDTNGRVRRRARVAVCVAVVAGALCAGAVVAKEHDVTIALRVSAAGLDLRQPTGARRFYARIQRAAWEVCTDGTRVDLVPLDDINGCYEKSLGDAIRSANLPALTNIYVATHTLQQAEACGIHVRVQAAAK